MGMNPEHIDFISAYCDRWCERCPLTHRCSTFSAVAAVAMCGDEVGGLELAFGTGPDDDGVERPTPEWHRDFDETEPSKEEAEALSREWREREERIHATPIMQAAWAVTRLGHPWLTANHQALSAGDAVVQEALAIAAHDLAFVTAKLRRALDGKEEVAANGPGPFDHPVQNDWNGSAKIALISLERSANAWSVLASSTGQETPAALATQMRDLIADVERAFPNARRFKRPGFDEVL
jgi:hypothetical protein